MGARAPIRVNADLVLPAEEVEVAFARSGGPGGQNVNKVETKVLLRFSIGRSRALSEDQKARLRTSLGARITASDDVLVHADSHRNRARNLEEARERLADLIAKALVRRRPRKASRPSRAAGERRLESKRRRSRVKRDRKDQE